MNIIDRIKSYFKKPEKFVLENNAENQSDYFTENLAGKTKDEVIFPQWLIDEDSLRDEGVIFGMGAANPEEKIKIIEALYEQKVAETTKKCEELNEKIAERNLIIEKKHLELEQINKKCELTENQAFKDENLLRVSVGVLISIGICAGNYFLIDHAIGLSFTSNQHFIAFGVFLTGMFSLFNPSSVLHQENQKLNWKSALEEFGVPLAAAFFVFVQTWGIFSPLKSVALFAFILLSFTVSGKILLSGIAKLKYEIRILKENMRLKSNKRKIETIWLEDKKLLENEMEQLRIEKWKILPELNRLQGVLDKNKNEKKAQISVFMSEYTLANNYRSKLNTNQIKNILG